MRILLAPMEGVVDPVIRHLLTAIGGIDFCVTEFVRVTDKLNPPKVFYRYCPELFNQSRTASGTPVFVQLLGGQPIPMGENAALACELGAYGIDLNFGCPAKTVNRHDGGATLLKHPERVFAVTDAVRRASPVEKPVTVKVRLGYSHKDYVTDIAQAAQAAGAHWLTVHARTKEEAYRPPAHWEYIARMREAISIPVIANGDIRSVADHRRCQEISGCTDTMIGRGLIAQPDLALAIKSGKNLRTWQQWHDFYLKFLQMSLDHRNEMYAVARAKQLSKLMGQNYWQLKVLFDKIKRIQEFYELKYIVNDFFAGDLAHATDLHNYARTDLIMPHSLGR